MFEIAGGIIIAMFVAGLFGLGIVIRDGTPEMDGLGGFLMALASIIGSGIVAYAFW